MNVILKQDVTDLGIEGQIVKVANGYFRNYLKPRDLAIEADKANIRWVEAKKAKAEQRLVEIKENAEKVSKRIGDLKIEFTLKAGERDRLFGSVTSMDIAEKLKENDFEIDRRKNCSFRTNQKHWAFHGAN